MKLFTNANPGEIWPKCEHLINVFDSSVQSSLQDSCHLQEQIIYFPAGQQYPT